jgi:tetratricopeptide (TPR) repeat protein
MNRMLGFMFFMLPAVASAAQATWITVQNPDFQVYSAANQRETRDALNQLERVRGFYIQMMGAPPAKPLPINIVIFGNEKDYIPYRSNSFSAAHYTRSADRDFIVIGKLGEQSAQVASHEYTHLVMAHAGYALPPWLNEGLAEFFSTLRPVGRNTEFGDLIPGRMYALNSEPWVPLQTILTADRDSPYYNETQQAGSLYNQSWVLVHMLATSEKYRAKFWDVVRAVNSGTPSVQALEQVYGMPFADLEQAVKSYVRGNSFRKLRADIKVDATESLVAQPADPIDVREVQAELLLGMRTMQVEARARLEALTQEAPARPRPWQDLGYLAWRQSQHEEAVGYFAKAFERGARSPQMLLDYSRLAQQTDPEGAMAALKALVELQPDSANARLLLANLLMSEGKYAEALDAARPIRAVTTAEERDRLLYLRAFALSRTGDLTNARAIAEQLKKASSSEAIQQRADAIIRYASQN